MSIPDRPFKDAAERFLVWREGNAVNWDTNYTALAKATGLSTHTVIKICKQKKWRLKHDALREIQTLNGERSVNIPVDSFMQMNHE